MSPADTYRQRLAEREAQGVRLAALSARLGGVRLLLGGAILLAAWCCFARHAFAAPWVLLPVVTLVGVILYHHDVRRLIERAQRGAEFYRRGLDRMGDRWMGQGQTGERFSAPHHIYGADLDLFGNGSLYQLLCAARTAIGESTLAQWLLSPASTGEILGRHASIDDLRGRLDFREQLAILGARAKASAQSEALMAWAEAPNVLIQPWLSWAAPSLALLAVAAAVSWLLWGTIVPLVLVLVVEGGVLYLLGGKIKAVIAGVEHAYEDLKFLAELLDVMERECVAAPALQALIAGLSSHDATAARAFASLATVVNLVESRRNLVVRPFIVPLLYTLQTALAAQRWRSAHGSAVRSWLSAIGEIEALASIAAYGYEHPDDPFPEFLEGAASFTAIELGHPLIPASTRVTNDVDISAGLRVLLVSGSNMSGKSTLLRTVGINTVLAMAGAPVRARSMHLTPLQIGASIHINDSLQEGSSRFYAEITRLRQLFEPQQRAFALLFLLDELLQGTNSSDRRLGAQGIVRALLARGAIGLISTHDLALTDLGVFEPGMLRNVHFQDEFEDGRLRCDFKLRDGIVTRSNGVALMRSIGLEV